MEWYRTQSKQWTPATAMRTMRLLEADVFPALGNRPISGIGTPELLAVIRKVEKRGALEMAARSLRHCNATFRFAAQTGISENNPAVNLRGALEPQTHSHHKYLTESELSEFFAKLDSNTGNLDLQTVLALRLIALTFVRTKELRTAKWQHFNFETKQWHIPAELMKKRRPHVVPLSEQTIKVLAELRKLTGHRELLLPNENKPMHPMSENTMLFGMYRMGYHSKATVHGFRATASTILNTHGFSSDHIELQLAHVEDNKVRAAYNHAEYLKERAAMMQWYANHLDGLCGRGQVIEFPAKKAA